jgi:hypothetical protein
VPVRYEAVPEQDFRVTWDGLQVVYELVFTHGVYEMGYAVIETAV